jgi:hypothetical protein
MNRWSIELACCVLALRTQQASGWLTTSYVFASEELNTNIVLGNVPSKNKAVVAIQNDAFVMMIDGEQPWPHACTRHTRWSTRA